MNCVVVILALVSAVSAGNFEFYSPVPYAYARPHIGSARYHSQDTLGQFDYGFASTDGIHRSERRDIYGNVEGRYGYTSPEGIRIETAYVAGLGGFQAVGNAIPEPVVVTPEVAAATYSHLAATVDAQYAHPYADYYGHDGYYDGFY